MAGLSGEGGRVSTRLALGREGVPLVIVDDAHPTPDALVATARGQRFDRTGDDFYPGIRSPAPDNYGAWLTGFAGAAWPRDGMALLRATFAIASDRRSALVPIQRIPHFDSDDAQMVAAVHYLCDSVYGGTGFYRHRRTGYERIDHRRRSSWRQALGRDVQAFGGACADGLAADALGFERIGGVAARFNRLVFFPANCLHSGDLGDVELPSPRDRGRLTVTSLLI